MNTTMIVAKVYGSDGLEYICDGENRPTVFSDALEILNRGRWAKEDCGPVVTLAEIATEIDMAENGEGW